MLHLKTLFMPLLASLPYRYSREAFLEDSIAIAHKIFACYPCLSRQPGYLHPWTSA